MSLLSIVILNYNGVKYLEEFLPGVIRHSEGFEIVVADNASSDHSIALVQEKFPSVRIIQLDSNYGFCGGYNRALQRLDSKYFLLLNSDIEVTANWLTPLLKLMEENPDVAAVQPKIRSYHQKGLFEYAGAAGGYIDKYGYPFCRGRILGVLEKDEGQYDDTTEIFWATGACMMVRSDLYLRFGGFDERFFAHMEEIDLCWRLKNAGYRIMCHPGSVVYHVGGGTLPKDNPRKVYYNFRNSLYVLAKNLPGKQLFGRILVRLALDFPAALFYLLKGSPGSVWSIFLAHISFYRMLSRLLGERVGKKISLESMVGCYPKSLLRKYYFTGVRKYSKL